METARLKQARHLFVNDLTPRAVQRHNMRQWVRALRLLGPRWLLCEPVRRQT